MRLNFDFPDNKEFDAVGLGLNAVDHLIVVPHFPEKNTKMPLEGFLRTGGGQIANAFTLLSRLGLKVKYLGKVGDDEMGDFSLQLLKEDNIDVSDVVRAKNTKNQYAFIMVDRSSGERTILWHRDKDLTFYEGDFSRWAVTSGKVLHIDSHEVNFSIIAAQWAREEGIPVLIDSERLRDRTFQLLPLGDILIADEQFIGKVFPGMNYRDALVEFHKRFNPRFSAITLGEEGSLGYFDNEIIHIPAYKVDVVDSTGAGDIYHGAFVYGILKNWQIPDIMRFASACAGLKCQGLGGRCSPSISEVKAFMGEDFPEFDKEYSPLLIINELKKINNEFNQDIIISAFETARKCHKGQNRDEGLPYIVHPFRVALSLIKDAGVTDPIAIATALLHDVVEDCNLPISYIEEKFGRETAERVELLTKPPKHLFCDPQQRQTLYNKKLLSCKDSIVMVIKLCDRLDNISNLHLSHKSREKKQNYINETRKIYLPLSLNYLPQIYVRIDKILRHLEESI